MNKIEKCPFCGNNDRRVGIRRMGNKGYRVVCGKCGGCGPYIAIKEWHDNKMIAQGQAIKAWNIRKPIENVLERLEERHKNHEKMLDDYRQIKDLYSAVKQSRMKCENEIAIEIIKEEVG